MFEIHVGELRARFLRNHNMRRHKGATKCPKRKTAQAQKTTQARQPPQPPQARGRCTRYGALHPIRGTAPVTWRCTRYVAVHPNRRGALPTDRVQRPNAQEQTRNWHTEPLTAAPLHVQLDPTGGRTGTPPTPPTPAPARRPRRHLHSGPLRHLHSGPLRHPHSGPLRHPHSDPLRHPHSGPLRHLPHPYMRRASKRPGSRQRPRPLRL